MTEFRAWPKIPRLNRNCIVTEKIDGTNSCVVISDPNEDAWVEPPICTVKAENAAGFVGVWAQSRKRLIYPGKEKDNYGFAGWVEEHAEALVAGLGTGRHFGEWWGAGIQRAYGQTNKRFSLFNAGRWHDQEANGVGASVCPDCCSVVPVVALGKVGEAPWIAAMNQLAEYGSAAAPGFDSPEGVVVYHTAAKSSFKVTFEQDDLPKSLAQEGN